MIMFKKLIPSRHWRRDLGVMVLLIAFVMSRHHYAASYMRIVVFIISDLVPGQ